MNPQRDALSEALRELAAASPDASPELGVRLSSTFARHHAQRRLRQRVAALIAIAACVAISLYWLRPRGQVAKINVGAPAAQSTQAPPPTISAEPKRVASDVPNVPAPSTARASVKPWVHAKSESKPLSHDLEAPSATVETADFVALPTFDPAIPVGDSHMVRMDLPGSALQLIGYPVEGQLLDRRILTDVLVGQDGMPYAVRLVQTRNVH